ncbi:glycosyltransferase family 61 protein [Rosistilla ulvae]|nr:glycosyltransferase family 61 protein [Rosistilla ulvae]
MDIANHNRKLVHYGKYVFALSTLLPFRLGKKKPTETLSTAELLDRYPRRVKLRWREEAGRLPVKSPRQAIKSDRTDDLADGLVMEIEGGWCHGRQCDWIGIDDVVLSELHRCDGPLAPKAVPGGWLNPRRIRRAMTTPRRLPQPVRVAGDVVVLNTSGSHNYFHWLCEVLPRLELVRQAGVLQADAYVVDNYKPFQRQALDLLGIPSDKVIEPHEGLLLHADRLIVPSLATTASRRRLSERLQSQLKSATNPPHAQPGRRLYVSRRLARNRSLGNDAEVAALLARHGFESHCLEQYTLEEQVRLFRDAAIVVGLHGAGLTNILLSARPIDLIEIKPSNCDRDYFQLLANEVGASCQQVAASRNRWRGSWHCPLEPLENAVLGAIAASETPLLANHTA